MTNDQETLSNVNGQEMRRTDPLERLWEYRWYLWENEQWRSPELQCRQPRRKLLEVKTVGRQGGRIGKWWGRAASCFNWMLAAGQLTSLSGFLLATNLTGYWQLRPIGHCQGHKTRSSQLSNNFYLRLSNIQRTVENSIPCLYIYTEGPQKHYAHLPRLYWGPMFTRVQRLLAAISMV